MDLDTAILRLERAKSRLENVSAFYAMHQSSWLTQAKVTVSQYLSAHRPPETDADRWSSVIEELTAKVSSALFEDGELTGLILFLAVEGGTPKGGGYAGPIQFDAIVRWVQAGREGDELGKRIMEGPGQMDAGKTNAAIAWRVFHALRTKQGGNIDRLRTAIDLRRVGCAKRG